MLPLSFHTLILIFFLFINTTIMHGTKRDYSSYTTMDRTSSHKKLRRLPHVFGKVLELPFKSDKDVYIEERSDRLRFTARANGGVVGGGIHVVELHPGITKVVVRRREGASQVSLIDDLEVDVWRFRLPMNACPELATVVYERWKVVVTVPKNVWGEKDGKGDDSRPAVKGFKKGNKGSLTSVQ